MNNNDMQLLLLSAQAAELAGNMALAYALYEKINTSSPESEKF